MEWVPIQTEIQVVSQLKIQRTMVDLQDLAIDLEELTQLEDPSLFSYRAYQQWPDRWDPNMVFGINFSMELSQELVERKLITVVDLLAEIGGFQGILTTIFAFILSAIYPMIIDKYLVTQLYKPQ